MRAFKFCKHLNPAKEVTHVQPQSPSPDNIHPACCKLRGLLYLWFSSSPFEALLTGRLQTSLGRLLYLLVAAGGSRQHWILKGLGLKLDANVSSSLAQCRVKCLPTGPLLCPLKHIVTYHILFCELYITLGWYKDSVVEIVRHTQSHPP